MSGAKPRVRLWAVLILLVYGAMLVALTSRLYLVSFEFETDLGNLYEAWPYWLLLGLCVAGQAVLLFVPVGAAEGRPVARRRLLAPILVSGLFFGLLVCGIVLSAFCGVWGDDPPEDGLVLLAAPAWGLASWALWGVTFWRYSAAHDAPSVIRRIVTWLLKGSALQLLVAVPSHVICRRRDDCCAPAGTFWGMCTGLAVMFLAFGPGVLFLYRERFRHLLKARSRAPREEEALARVLPVRDELDPVA